MADPVSSSDYQQKIGAPLEFFTQVACNSYSAAATRDDVRHYDAMRVALQTVAEACQYNEQRARIAELEADCARLREDAERYMWLRAMIYDDRIIVQPDRMLHGEELDAAIDAARREKP